jgi:hypothetical protein
MRQSLAALEEQFLQDMEDEQAESAHQRHQAVTVAMFYTLYELLG